MHRASILAIAALLIPAAVVSQTDTSVGMELIDALNRDDGSRSRGRADDENRSSAGRRSGVSAHFYR